MIHRFVTAIGRETRDPEFGAEYEHSANDINSIAAGLHTLDVVLARFTGTDYQAARDLATAAVNGDSVEGIRDIRVVVAALRSAYDPMVAGLSAQQAAENIPRLNRLVEVMKQSAAPGMRAARELPDAVKRKAAHLSRAQTWLSQNHQ